MKKFDKSIHDLAQAIYKTRPTPAAAFDPHFALSELAHMGAKCGLELMLIQSKSNGFEVSLDQKRIELLLSAETSDKGVASFELYYAAMLRHEPFTDVLGMANEVLDKTHGVRLPDFFVSGSMRLYCQQFATNSLGKGIPVLRDDHDRSSSGVLASMSGLLSQPTLLMQRKVRILMTCQSELATKMMLMQLFNPLCNLMAFVEWVKIAEGNSTKGKQLVSVQRQHHSQRIAC